jgi:acetylornithine deacetylase
VERLAPVEVLERLVSFDTVSERSNRAMIDWIADYLAGFGVIAAIAADDSGTKADLIATIGPSVPGGIILSGHSDVVPVAGQKWSSDPFRLTEKDGLLYGRGSADMKGFIAVALALVPEFLAMNPAKPLHLVLSFDEELAASAARGSSAAM